MRLNRDIGLCVAVLLLSGPALCQSLFVAPSQTVDDQIGFLMGERRSSRVTLEARGVYGADNNLEDFARAGIRHPSPSTFSGGMGYYTDAHAWEWGVAQGQWEVRYSQVSADLYRGNPSAAQLYLDSLSNSINTSGVYNPYVMMSRSRGDRYRASYTTPVHLGRYPALVMGAFNYYRLQMVDMGTLQGSTVNGQFDGQLNLNSTLGVPSGQVNSQAATLDAGVSMAITSRLRGSLTAENLIGYAWQRRVQNIQATLQTNTLVPNQDGFLSGAPLVSGQLTQQSLGSDVASRFNFGLTYRDRSLDWLGLISYDFDWRAAVGADMRLGHGNRAWLLLYPAPFEWKAGAHLGPFVLQLGLSSIDLGTSRRADVELGYTLTL